MMMENDPMRIDREILRAAESMKLFERDGMIHFGTWRQWWRATPEEAAEILQELKTGNPRSTTTGNA